MGRITRTLQFLKALPEGLWVTFRNPRQATELGEEVEACIDCYPMQGELCEEHEQMIEALFE